MKGLIPSPQTPLQVMHKAEKKYIVGKVADEEEAKQRQLKAILNKLMPQNFEKMFEQVKALNIDNAVTLAGVVLQIFDKALMEPTFCEMYANILLHLAVELPDFNENDEKVTFKRLLLNKCQEEFERGVREQEEANKADEEGEVKPSEEEKEEKRIKARGRMLGNIRLIGELYKKKMLTERIMHECIKRLLGEYQNPDEEDIEALCKLMSTIGEMIDHPKAKVHMEAYFDRMAKLSDNLKLSSRVRFMLKDTIDLRKNKWQQRRKVEGPKKIEEVHGDAAQERQQQFSRLARNPGMNIYSRRTSMDFGPRGSSMLSPHYSSIEVKAMVDKEKNQIIFVESNADFVDVLLGFLTMPMGSIIRLIHNHPPTIGIGCTNNLYRSAESLAEMNFRTPQCKSMLLQPQNGAEAQFNRLKVKICAYEPYWYICSASCATSKHKLLSRYDGAFCACGEKMNFAMIPEEGVPKGKAHADDEGVFIKGMIRHLITSDLQIIPLSTASTLSLLSRTGVANASAIEERTFDIRVNEVVNLLAWSLVSKAPLTETLLKPEAEPKLIKEELFHGTGYRSEVGNSGDGTVCVRLMVSKSKKLVCYADVSNDFVDLLFGFLTVPLGYIFKEMCDAPSKGCAFHLYKSVEDLDAGKYLKSEEHKNMLLCPKVAPLFGFEKQILNVEEALNKKYYCFYDSSSGRTRLVTDKSLVPSSSTEISELTVMDPKSPFKKATKGGGGFLKAHTMFTVTDDLIITPVSPIMCLSILNKMEVPPEDVEELFVHVGKKEASDLLIASFMSETPLTDVFLRQRPRQVLRPLPPAPRYIDKEWIWPTYINNQWVWDCEWQA